MRQSVATRINLHEDHVAGRNIFARKFKNVDVVGHQDKRSIALGLEVLVNEPLKREITFARFGHLIKKGPERRLDPVAIEVQ
jgi:glyoxylase-like metal-dependent hydrolase (beta-lactamase superfamily II)